MRRTSNFYTDLQSWCTLKENAVDDYNEPLVRKVRLQCHGHQKAHKHCDILHDDDLKFVEYIGTHHV